jgi:two-component system OmpR family sensor kinase
VKSLHRRLLISLWLAVLLVGTGLAGIAYYQVNHETRHLLDSQLAQIASIVAAQTDPWSRTIRANRRSLEVGVLGLDGTVQYASSAFMRGPFSAKSGFSDMVFGTEPYRVYSALVGERQIYIAQPTDVRDDQAEAAALAAFLPILLLLPVLAIVMAWVIRATLQPMRAAAAAVARRNAFDRTALYTHDLPSEVAPLVEEINRLLDRQGEAVQRERHFIADAAHALRTPLAALQLQIDVLDGSKEPAERAARLADLRAGIQRAARLSEQLLSLARIETCPDSDQDTVDVDAILHDVLALYRPAAAATQVSLQLEARSGAQVQGQPRRLLLIFGNLLDNALRYSPSGGRIELLATTDGEMACIEIRDQGPGLDPGQLSRVFERFYHVPGDAKAGSGLGLSSVEEAVRQMSGNVILRNRTDRNGLTAHVILPRRLG